MKRYLFRSSIVMVLILSPFAITLSFFGSRIMRTLYGPGYGNTQTILILLSLNLLALSFSHRYSRGLFTLQAAKADTIVNLMAVFLLFIVGVMAVKYYSVAGAAAALPLSTFAIAIMRVVAFSRVAAPVSEEVTLQPVAIEAL